MLLIYINLKLNFDFIYVFFDISVNIFERTILVMGRFYDKLYPAYSIYKTDEYLTIAKFLDLGVVLGLILLLAGFFVSPRKIDNEKISAYECGFEPFESARIKFNIHYYLIAILFIIFDAEIIFLFPWILSSSLLNLYTYPVVIFFLIVLTLGFVIEWVQSLLKW